MLFAKSGVKSGAIVSYAYTFVNSIVSIIYVPLLLSSIGREEYGLYQLIGSIMAYIVSINGILASGVGRYYCMYKAEDDQTKMENTLAIAKRMYWALSVVTVAVILIVSMAFRTIYSTSFSQALVDEGSAMLLVLGVNCIVVMNNAITIAAITANERFVFLKGTQLVSLVVQPVIVVAVATTGPIRYRRVNSRFAYEYCLCRCSTRVRKAYFTYSVYLSWLGPRIGSWYIRI